MAVAKCCWCDQPLELQRIKLADVWRCPTKACFERQAAYALLQKAKGAYSKLIYLPLPKQTVAHEAVDSRKHRRILYGGAAGGSKSHWLRWLAYGKCLKHPGLRVLLLRRTFPELEKTHMRAAMLDAPKIGARFIETKRLVVFGNDSLLEFGHCQDAADVTHYLSAEYDLILFDELVTFECEQYLMISSRARTTREDWTPLVIGGTNPGGPHAAWVVERFIDKTFEDTFYNPEDYCYIPATLDDNPYIDASYEQLLNDLPEALREAYRHGRWDIFPGQFFREFRKEKHVRALEIPDEIPRIGGMDWGYLSKGVLLVAVVLPDGHVHIMAERVFKETLAVDAARLLRQYRCQAIYADPAMWIRDGQTGESIAETMIREGLPLHRANHERINGWQRVRHWLRDDPTDVPWLTISPECKYLARSLPSLVQDEKNLEDVDTTCDDHGGDALRYLLMSRPTPWGKTPTSAPSGTAGAMLRDLMRENESRGNLGGNNVRF